MVAWSNEPWQREIIERDIKDAKIFLDDFIPCFERDGLTKPLIKRIGRHFGMRAKTSLAVALSYVDSHVFPEMIYAKDRAVRLRQEGGTVIPALRAKLIKTIKEGRGLLDVT